MTCTRDSSKHQSSSPLARLFSSILCRSVFSAFQPARTRARARWRRQHLIHFAITAFPRRITRMPFSLISLSGRRRGKFKGREGATKVRHERTRTRRRNQTTTTTPRMLVRIQCTVPSQQRQRQLRSTQRTYDSNSTLY
jgi:hypothetical protein